MPVLQPSLVVAFAAALAPALAAAGGCKLKYRVNGISGTLSGTLSANQSHTLNRNGVVEALNDGRDDLQARRQCFESQRGQAGSQLAQLRSLK